MKIKKLTDLSEEELLYYTKSSLYEEVCKEYSLCNIHLEYYKEYYGKEYSDYSIVAFEENTFYWVCYIFIDENSKSISKFGSALPIFEIEMEMPKRKKVYSEVFSYLENLGKEKGINKILFRNNPVFLERYFEKDLSYSLEQNSIIDLSQAESDIRMGVRKSYKSLINWGYKNMNIEVYDSSNYNDCIIEAFEKFHIEVAKRRTRSHESWILQGEAVKKGKGLMIFGYLNDSLVSAVYVCLSSTSAYYGVAVNDRELMAKNLPIGHATLMEGIIQSKRRGIKKFNLGNVILSEDEKLNAISKYKRGFSPIIETNVIYTANLF